MWDSAESLLLDVTGQLALDVGVVLQFGRADDALVDLSSLGVRQEGRGLQ